MEISSQFLVAPGPGGIRSRSRMEERTKQILALGREHYDNREYDKAEHYLKQLIDRNVQYADVFNMLGVIHHDRGRFEDAQAAFEDALAINPNYTEAALNLAVTYNDLGRYDEAKRIYQAALGRSEKSEGSLDPFVRGKIANLHAEVALAYADAGLIDAAVLELKKSVALCPHFADLRLRLANLYRQQGNLEGARLELDEAVKARPTYVPARVAYGVVLLSQGETAAAIEQWKAALDADPENKTAQMYLRMTQSPST
jgi:tetratricopeptide (TPR) repeat protein